MTLPPQPAQLSTSHLISMALDIAAGATYLASKKVVHRDLATRNCLVGAGQRVKISNFGLGRLLREKDYYRTRVCRVVVALEIASTPRKSKHLFAF